MDEKNTTYSKKVIEIADFMLRNPHRKTAEILAYFGGKWRKGRRTIERYYKDAKEYNKKRIQRQEEAKDAVMVSAAKEAVKKAIITRDELLEFYTNEIREYKDTKSGKKKGLSVGGVVIMPTFQDAKNAGVEIAKMQGYYAPTKNEITGRDGSPLIPEPMTIEIIDSREKVLKRDADTDNESIRRD